MNSQKAFQEYYPEHLSHCYGCGRLNEQGLRIKSYWDGDLEESICRIRPKPFHTAIPGYVYGGLIASIIDCHSTGTAAAIAYRHENRNMESDPPLRFLTGSLHVDYLKPTPIDTELIVRAQIKEKKGRKVIVSSKLFANDIVCAQGEVVAIQVPENLMPK